MLDASLIDDLTLVLAAVAPGRSVVPKTEGRTRTALEALGARIVEDHKGFTVHGTGNGCLLAAASALRFGDNAAAATLVTGLVASYAMPTRIECSGPAPTALFAALATQGMQVSQIDAQGWTVEGPPSAHPVQHDGGDWDIVSIMAVLLAALNVPGETSIAGLTRDPLDMAAVFRRFAAGVESMPASDGAFALRATGQLSLSPLSGPAP